jgi:hypothetical protein
MTCIKKKLNIVYSLIELAKAKARCTNIQVKLQITNSDLEILQLENLQE